MSWVPAIRAATRRAPGPDARTCAYTVQAVLDAYLCVELDPGRRASSQVGAVRGGWLMVDIGFVTVPYERNSKFESYSRSVYCKRMCKR